jgi:hypothetical protein
MAAGASNSPDDRDVDGREGSGSQGQQGAIARIRDAGYRTRVGVGVALGRRDGQSAFAALTLGYLLLYLWIVGDLGRGRGSIGLTIVPDPLARALSSTGTFSYEAIALVEAGPVTYLFSPLNLVVGGLLAVLVGLNLALTLVAWRQPAACGIDASTGTGLLAGVPALLSGTACCGPIILIVVGVQASGLLLLAFDLLVPMAVLLLLIGLVLVGRRVDPERVTA